MIPLANAGDAGDEGSPVFLPGKSHGQSSLVGCSPWGHKESGMTEQLLQIIILLRERIVAICHLSYFTIKQHNRKASCRCGFQSKTKRSQ